jgi:hypothetical protein
VNKFEVLENTLKLGQKKKTYYLLFIRSQEELKEAFQKHRF